MNREIFFRETVGWKLPPTLTESSKRWLEKRAALSASTRETYEAALKHLRAMWGSVLVCEIDARDIVAYQKARLAQHAAGATINKEIACLSSILSEYGMWEQLRRDVKGLDENKPGRALSRVKEKWLLDHASHVGVYQGSWTPLYTVAVLGLNTGMRHQEIRTLKWRNLDLENRVLRVGESKTEAGRGRPIPLTKPAWAALDKQAAEKFDWLTILPEDEKPLRFTFAIGSVPIRFYRGEAGDPPGHYISVAETELYQQQLAFQIDGIRLLDQILRLAVEVDKSREVSGVYLVEMDKQGSVTETYNIPFEIDGRKVLPLQPKPIDVAPPQVEALKKPSDKKLKGGYAGSQ